MTYALSEPFNDAYGRWDGFAPFDSTEAFRSAAAFLATQTHVDLRSFRSVFDVLPAPQNPDLDVPPQTTLEGETQTQMETNTTINRADEFWATTGSPTGVASWVVQKIAARGGWSGLQATTDAAALDVTFVSSMTTAIDLSTMTKLSIIFPDYNTFDGASAAVTLSSDPAGAFGTGHDSAVVHFSANLSVMPQLLLALSGFANSGFSLAKVTGIKIRLVKAVAPGAGQTITMMAIRGLQTGWSESSLDFDTRIGAVCVPVTLTGAPYGGSIAQHFEFARGDGGHEDPIPADTAMNIFFYPGGETSPNDADNADLKFNKLSAILRETKDNPDGLGSHIEASLFWNDTTTKFEAKRRDTTGGSPPATTTDVADFSTTIGGALDPSKQYLFSVEIRGTQISASLYESDFEQEVGNFVWHLPTTLTDIEYTYRNGRVGFIADLLTRDAFVNAINVAPTGFAELVTSQDVSRTPVDGVQLAAVASSDINLWDSFTGPDLLIDQTKTLSGAGSFRSAKSLTTNTFIMDDWTQSYLDVAIWVPASVTATNQPQIYLNTDSGQERLVLPKLQPAQWNQLHFDLGIFRNLITGSGYSISIQAANNPDRPLGYFWVDSTLIGRRRIAWYTRATANGPFRPFKDLVNKHNGAVHFNPDERGTELQLKAVALTTDAWVSSFRAFPRYANLGNFVFDQGFDDSAPVATESAYIKYRAKTHPVWWNLDDTYNGNGSWSAGGAVDVMYVAKFDGVFWNYWEGPGIQGVYTPINPAPGFSPTIPIGGVGNGFTDIVTLPSDSIASGDKMAVIGFRLTEPGTDWVSDPYAEFECQIYDGLTNLVIHDFGLLHVPTKDFNVGNPMSYIQPWTSSQVWVGPIWTVP